MIGEQHAVAFGLAPAHTAPELVELRQAEPLGVFHHHAGGIGHIHAYLDHRGGHQNITVSGGKGLHDSFFFFGLHLPVEQAHPQVGEDLLPQLFGVGRGGLALVGDLILLAYQGTHDEHLMPLGHLFADELVDPPAVGFVYGKSIHLLPTGGQLIHHRHIQIAVDYERQGPGDGRGGQHQHMGVFRLLPQRRPLVHTKAVLLVGDDQPQPLIGHIRRQEGVGADTQVNFSRRQSRQNIPPFLCPGGAGEQGASQTEFSQQRS